MTDRAWDVVISLGGMLLIVVIYAIVNYVIIKKWDRRDKEMFERMFAPPPEPKRGGPTPVA